MRHIDATGFQAELARVRAELQAGRDRIAAIEVRRVTAADAQPGTRPGPHSLAWRTFRIGVHAGTLLATSGNPRRMLQIGTATLCARLLRRGLDAARKGDRA